MAQHPNSKAENRVSQQVIEKTYKEAKLNGVIDFKLFRDAFIAYQKTPDRKKSILTIIDYSKPSTEKTFLCCGRKQKEADLQHLRGSWCE